MQRHATSVSRRLEPRVRARGEPRARHGIRELYCGFDYQAVPIPATAAALIVPGQAALPKYVPALVPAATSPIENVLPDFESSCKHTEPRSPVFTASPTNTFNLPPQSRDDSMPFMPAVDVSFEYVWLSVYTVFSAVKPLRRSDCAARSWAR